MIPKIIHQFAPKDTSRWHAVWYPCHESWKDNHKTFIHILWSEELLNNFVKEKFSEHYDLYKSAIHICQIDIAKFMVLHYYGGIYVDMDVYCYENFHDKLNKEFCLVESTPGTNNETHATFFIASKSKNLFANLLIKNSLENLKNSVDEKFIVDKNFNSDLIKNIAGPTFISNEYQNFYNKESVQILNWQEYNPERMFYSENVKMKHMLSGMWGKEDIDAILAKTKNSNLSNYDQFKKSYSEFRGIHLDDFDFRKNYLE